MFTGIIESTLEVVSIDKDQSNLDLWFECLFINELKVDQSIAHNGVCLTVAGIQDNKYKVTAIDETLQKSNLGSLQVGDRVNIERCLQFNGRIDGHIVQGHVDQTGELTSIENKNGSFILTFSYNEEETGNVTVEKGSVCVNGVSLTVVDSGIGRFSVAIIPYTWEFTNLSDLKVGDLVNLEFDILGKYIRRLMKSRI